MWVDITLKHKTEYNQIVLHPLQSYEWGEFRKLTGVKIVRRGLEKNGKLIDAFTLTIHNVPRTKFKIGYFPKGPAPSKEVLTELKRIGKENNCIFIQLEPNVTDTKLKISDPQVCVSHHPLFTKYTFILDISKSEEELLKNFHPKTRYNIRVAEKHNVKVSINNSKQAFEKYLELTHETTTRQNFYAHTPSYHTKMWNTLSATTDAPKNLLAAQLLTASYKTPEGTTELLATWVLFTFHNYLYYPYGASSSKYRNTMSSNLIMWEAIKFGKKMGLTYFDMWGALGPNPDQNDPWYGFHRFKQGYGATHTEFIGSFDLVIHPLMYQVYKITDHIRWGLLRIKKRIT